MKHVLPAIALCFLLTAAAVHKKLQLGPSKLTAQPKTLETSMAEFFAECLRNADRAINVRLVTTNRR